MRLAPTSPLLAVSLLLGCAEAATEPRDYGTACFIRGTLEQSDGTVIDYDVPAVVEHGDSGTDAIETDYGQAGDDTIHGVRVMWRSDTELGSYDLRDGEVGLVVALRLAPGQFINTVWWQGLVSFTRLDDGLAGTVTVTPIVAASDDLIVDLRDLEFGCALA